MDSNTLLFYKLNKYQNKLGKDPNSIIYQQKYAYYKDLIGGGKKYKSITIKNYFKEGGDTTKEIDVILYISQKDYEEIIEKLIENNYKKDINVTYLVHKYKVNNIEYKKYRVYKRTDTTSSPPYDLCLKEMKITFKNGERPKIILDYIKSDTEIIKYEQDHFVTADFLQHQSTKTNKNCKELEEKLKKKLEKPPIKA